MLGETDAVNNRFQSLGFKNKAKPKRSCSLVAITAEEVGHLV